MTGDRELMLFLFLLVVITILIYTIEEIITAKIKQMKRRKERYNAYKLNRRAAAETTAKELENVYNIVLFNYNNLNIGMGEQIK